MKLIAWILGIAVVLTGMNYNSWKKSGEPAQQEAAKATEEFNPVVNYQKTVLNEVDNMQVRLLEQQEKARKNAYDAEKIKIYVRARDTKTCMKDLKIDVINNEVAECNRDHFVEIRRDELENYKKEHGL